MSFGVMAGSVRGAAQRVQVRSRPTMSSLERQEVKMFLPTLEHFV